MDLEEDSSHESFWAKVISRLLLKFRVEIPRKPSSQSSQRLLVASISVPGDGQDHRVCKSHP